MLQNKKSFIKVLKAFRGMLKSFLEHPNTFKKALTNNCQANLNMPGRRCLKMILLPKH